MSDSQQCYNSLLKQISFPSKRKGVILYLWQQQKKKIFVPLMSISASYYTCVIVQIKCLENFPMLLNAGHLGMTSQIYPL